MPEAGAVIFWLGFILPICYVPGVTGASIPTQWGVLAAVLPLGLWRAGRVTSAHWLGIWFILYSAMSLLWAVNPYDAGWGFAVVLIWAGSFWLGSTLESLEGLWKGLAIGLTVNVAVAAMQAFGYHPIFEAPVSQGYPGLLYSPLVSGSVSALVIVGLVCHRLWRYIPGVLPLLILSHSRGGWLVLAVGVAGRYLGWRAVAVIVMVAGGFMYFHPSPSDIQRMQVWDAAYSNLRWFGLGVGSFTDLWMMIEWVKGSPVMERPEFAHNDYIQLVFEAGLGAIPIYCIFAGALTRTSSQEWPVFAGFAALGLFYFPLHSPLSAFIGCAVAGHIVAGWYSLRCFERECRSYIVSGVAESGPAPARIGEGSVPVAS